MKAPDAGGGLQETFVRMAPPTRVAGVLSPLCPTFVCARGWECLGTADSQRLFWVVRAGLTDTTSTPCASAFTAKEEEEEKDPVKRCPNVVWMLSK